MEGLAEAWRFVRPQVERDPTQLVAEGLADTRAQTLGLISARPDVELMRHHSALLMSPIVRGLAPPRSTRPTPPLANGFVYGMTIQHEQQHDETILACLQLINCFAYRPRAQLPSLSPARSVNKRLYLEGGPFVSGTDQEALAYDNERPALGSAQAVPDRFPSYYQS